MCKQYIPQFWEIMGKHRQLTLKLLKKTKLFALYSYFPGSSDGKVSAYNAGDWDSIPGLGRSPGGGNGNPPQYSCLENPIDRGAWWAAVHGVAKSRTRLHFHFHFELFWKSKLVQKNFFK